METNYKAVPIEKLRIAELNDMQNYGVLLNYTNQIGNAMGHEMKRSMKSTITHVLLPCGKEEAAAPSLQVTEDFKAYMTDAIMDKQSPLYYGDVLEMIDGFCSSPVRKEAEAKMLSELEYKQYLKSSPMNEGRSAQFKKGMYAGYLEYWSANAYKSSLEAEMKGGNSNG